MEDLQAKFLALTDEEKMEFIKLIMPVMCKIFSKNPQKMMMEIMPYCRDMMKEQGMDMGQMMNMMRMMDS